MHSSVFGLGGSGRKKVRKSRREGFARDASSCELGPFHSLSLSSHADLTPSEQSQYKVGSTAAGTFQF